MQQIRAKIRKRERQISFPDTEEVTFQIQCRAHHELIPEDVRSVRTVEIRAAPRYRGHRPDQHVRAGGAWRG